MAPFVVCAALALLFAPVPTAWLGVWHGRLFGFGHVPLFAALFLALRARLGARPGRPLLAAVALAGLVEVVQPLVGRSGDWMDFVRGSLGALSAALGGLTWERRSGGRACWAAGLAVAAVAWPVWEVAPYAADTVAGHRAVPVLASFATDRELLRWEREQATAGREAGGGCRVEFLTGPAEYPGVSLRPMVVDFSGARWLCCAFRVPDAPVELVISLRTGARTGGTTHTDVARRYPAGAHTARLDLAEAAARGRPAPLALDDVRSVAFFLVRPEEPRSLVLTRVWLEP